MKNLAEELSGEFFIRDHFICEFSRNFMNFQDKVVLVTGASRGIGREIASQFAEHGANLIVHYNQNHVAAEETVRHLAGNNHLIVQADMQNPRTA